jgi:hypothetical protein
MAIKGRLKYIPGDTIEEWESIKRNLNISEDAEAFRKMADFSRIGRQLEVLMRGRRR